MAMFFQCAEPVDVPAVWVCECPENLFCAGLPDLDGDGVVGINDFLDLLALWGPTDCGSYRRGDLDMDLEVGIEDLLILLGAWIGSYDPSVWDRCV